MNTKNFIDRNESELSQIPKMIEKYEEICKSKAFQKQESCENSFKPNNSRVEKFRR